MGTIAEKLNKILQTKEAIRTAINNKGGTLTTSDKFSDYATSIDNIQSGSANEPITITENGTYTAPDGIGYSPINVNVPSKEEETKSITITENGTTTVLPTSGKVLSKVDIVANVPQIAESGTLKNLLDNTKSAYNLFYSYRGTSVDDLIKYSDTSNVTNMSNMFTRSRLITIPQLDTSTCTDMSYMFNNCERLKTIPQLDTSSCTNVTGMFSGCFSLQTISQLDTGKCANMRNMFSNCSSLTTIPQLDTSTCTDMSYTFNGCYRVKSIDLTHMKITSTNSSSSFANNCYSLTKLIIRNMDTIPTLNSNAFNKCYHFYGTQNDTYNPEGLKDGRIYVPDNKVEELKVATNWSVFSDIIVPLSTLEENS